MRPEIHRFVKQVFPQGRYLTGVVDVIHPEWEFIEVSDPAKIDTYYDRLVHGGIMAGECPTLLDNTPIGACWIHVKGDRKEFRHTPIIITIDRSQRAHDEMAKWGIRYAFKRGIKHEDGWRGLSQTYLNIFKANRFKDVMIFEDDIKFIRSPHTFNVADYPSDWDAIYLGANIRIPCEPGNEVCSRLISGWTTHAVLYRSEFVQRIVAEYDMKLPIDEYLSRLMPETKQYVCKPFYAVQEDGYSLIQQQNVKYDHIFNSQKYLS
jgi:hypothetical protein